jgi:cobyrinic acid a,c-diamide synthase
MAGGSRGAVADASAMARSAAALVHGFETFDPGLDLAAVIFNRIGGQRHADLLREALVGTCRCALAGSMPRNDKISLPSRHLGLTMAEESLTGERLAEMVTWIEQHLDLDTLLELARARSPDLTIPLSDLQAHAAQTEPQVRIGVARDPAFCFYYQDNLDLLRESGAETVVFSPMDDKELPPGLGGLYLGGGYPELHAERLARNREMHQAIGRFAHAGGPVYAKCGGFMYLTEAIVDAAGREYPMADLFPTRARMQPRLAALGYMEAEAIEDELWLRAGERLRGHEFRYSEIDAMPPEVRRCFALHGSRDERKEGYVAGSVLAGYAHLHFRSAPEFAARFVQACIQYRTSEGFVGASNT